MDWIGERRYGNYAPIISPKALACCRDYGGECLSHECGVTEIYTTLYYSLRKFCVFGASQEEEQSTRSMISCMQFLKAGVSLCR